jgi:deazaflavin-dependent oxidoreductase (nitroreductase family)
MDLGIKVLMAVNTFLYQLTRGRLGSKMAGQTVLLLNTTGRKSGKTYKTPINYYRDHEDYLVVASNWGKDQHPEWYFNLMRQPETTIQVKDRILRVRVRSASDADYERLWSFVTSQNEFYIRYQRQTQRKIPIVILSEYEG